jgi:hypothetical protein
MLNDIFWFALGMLALAGVLARSADIAGRLDEGDLHDGA